VPFTRSGSFFVDRCVAVGPAERVSRFCRPGRVRRKLPCSTSSSSSSNLSHQKINPRTAGPLTPPPPPAWSAQTGRGLGARPYSSSSTLDNEAAAAPAAPAAPASPRPALTLTPAAAGRVRDLLARPDAVAAGHTALRLTVEAGGCSGFSYVFAMDTGPQKGDTVVGDEGGTTPLLMIDPVSLGLVRGGTVDFVSELIKAGFEVTVNPNADAGCGCGASFTPKL
jgi:iron-sulfur cluster assembly accessory protein